MIQQDKYTLIFFYGLYMYESVLTEKGIQPASSAIGYVDGYALHIGERATLVREEGGRTYGIMMDIDEKEAQALYADESVADYRRESVVVHLNKGVQRDAFCYNLPYDQFAGTNTEYATALFMLATKLCLPENYLSQIKKFIFERQG